MARMAALWCSPPPALPALSRASRVPAPACRTAPLARPVLCRAALRAPAAASTRATPGRGSEGLDLSKLSFPEKLAFAWSVFFPAKEADHARNDAKKRLRMILVADRCALSPQSMSDMKAEIVRVVSEFVIVDQGETVDVNMTNDEEMGTIYSVAIPIKRIKPAFDASDLAAEAQWEEGPTQN